MTSVLRKEWGCIAYARPSLSQDASGIAGSVAMAGGIERQEQALETRVESYWEM